MSPTYELPDHSRFRYKIQTHPAPGRPDLVEVSLWTYGYGKEARRAAVATAPAEYVPDALQRVLTVADAYDDGPTGGGPIGDAARMTLAAQEILTQHDRGPGRLDPDDYALVHHYLAQVLAMAEGLYQRMALASADFADYCDAVDEPEGRMAWANARRAADIMRASLAETIMPGDAVAEMLAAANGYSFTCGDCVEGICHWGGGNTEGGRLGEARRREASGERCGCQRHDVSVAMRRPERDAQGDAGIPSEADVRAAVACGLAGDVTGLDLSDPAVRERVAADMAARHPYGPAELGEAVRIIGEWYGTSDRAPGGPWLQVAYQPGGASPFILGEFGRDTAGKLLDKWDPFNPARLLYPDAQFVNRHKRPLPRFAMVDPPENLDDVRARTQFAREVYAKMAAEREAVDLAGAAVFEVPGSGPLLLPAEVDLAEVCLRLGVDVEFEASTRAPDGLVIIDDPVREPGEGPWAADHAAELAARTDGQTWDDIAKEARMRVDLLRPASELPDGG